MDVSSFFYTFRNIRIQIYQNINLNSKQWRLRAKYNLPGVYEVAWHASIQDIIELAGGLSEESDISSINVSKEAGNEDVITIPKKQESTCISINTATLQELDTLKGIGPKVAQRIIDYRSTTPFQTLEDLKNVKGIGDAMFLTIQAQLCL